jgi:hypothetical protein
LFGVDSCKSDVNVFSEDATEDTLKHTYRVQHSNY